MKKNVITAMFCIGLGVFSVQMNAQDLNVMKEQREVLKLHTDLMDKKIDLEKENQNNAKIKGTAEGLNNKSDKKTDNFSSSDAASTAKDAKNTAKLLKKTESANKDLDRSNNKVISLEADIRKLETKLDRLKYTIEVKEK